MPDIQTIVSILWRYKKRENLSEEELIVMQDWLKESTKNQQLFEDLSNDEEWAKLVAVARTGDSNATWDRIWQRIEEKDRKIFGEDQRPVQSMLQSGPLPWLKFAAAAAVILIGLIVAGSWWLIGRKANAKGTQSLAQQHTPSKTDFPPGSRHATLTLADGKVVALDSLSTGKIDEKGVSALFKKDSGTLAYDKDSAEWMAGKQESYNILKTPGGGEYHVILPDGSQVWLNAASSLKYPLHFAGKWRAVALTGEAYFEVAKNPEKPFIVEAGSVEVSVLGTHFNVNAYANEPSVNTTLLEGSVAVRSGKVSSVIRPGQEIRFNSRGGLEVVQANTDQVMAWHNKIFWFTETPFDEIMRQLARWYNMEVVFNGKIEGNFSGILPRDQPASYLFSLLEKGGKVKFKIEGNTVTVSP